MLWVEFLTRITDATKGREISAQEGMDQMTYQQNSYEFGILNTSKDSFSFP